ncbi:DUF1016 domain-containing protein [Tannockella kyphosi]|uniref:DUF1016 domain-containing protein n=1 Tax=Tannockella kyphosi TaxID=2899121 RepID=UPI0020117E31|nr:DUF1016 domain-containing protein [Tannockella kyphosi]
MYVNYCDREVKLPEENATIGIILCKDKKQAIPDCLSNMKDVLDAESLSTLVGDREDAIILDNPKKSKENNIHEKNIQTIC